MSIKERPKKRNDSKEVPGWLKAVMVAAPLAAYPFLRRYIRSKPARFKAWENANKTMGQVKREAQKNRFAPYKINPNSISRNQDHDFVTTGDVHVDSALHIPKRNKRLRRTPAKGYNAPMTTSKVSTPMALPNKGRMTPTDQTRGFSAPEGNVAYADEKKNKEFAVGALAKVGLGLLKKKKQIVPGTSVKSGLSRLQPRRTSATLSPTAQKGRALSDTRKKAATAVKRAANSQSRRAQAAKNPLLSTKAGKQARRLKRGIKRNPVRSAAIAAGAGIGAGYLLSNDEDFDENEFSALYKKGLKTGAGVAGGLGGLIGIGHGSTAKKKREKKRSSRGIYLQRNSWRTGFTQKA